MMTGLLPLFEAVAAAVLATIIILHALNHEGEDEFEEEDENDETD